MGLLDEAVPGNKAVPGGRWRTEDGQAIKEESPVGVPSGISGSQEDGRNRGVFLYHHRRLTTRRG